MSSRKMSEMSAVEKAQAQNHTSIIDNSLSTDEERKQARLCLDALMWRGIVGPVMERISNLTVRLDNVEEKGQALSDDDREALVTLRDLSGKIDGSKLDDITESLLTCLARFDAIETIAVQHHSKSQTGWKEHEAILVEARIKRQAIAKKVEVFEQQTDEEFLRVKAMISELRAETNLVIVDLLADAKTEIMESAETAAIEAVGRMLGESDVDGGDKDEEETPDPFG